MLYVLTDTVSVPGAEPAVFIITAPVVMTLTSLVIPLITGLVTKWTLAPWIKGVITIVLNAVAACLLTATQADGTAVFSVATLTTLVYGVVVSVVTYLAAYKPAGLTSHVGGKLAPDKGIGPKTSSTAVTS